MRPVFYINIYKKPYIYARELGQAFNFLRSEPRLALWLQVCLLSSTANQPRQKLLGKCPHQATSRVVAEKKLGTKVTGGLS